MRNLLTIVLAAGAVAAGVAACDDDSGPFGPPVEQVVVTPQSPTVGEGQSLDLTAQVVTNNRTASTSVTWTSSNPATVSVSPQDGNTATITGQSIGTATVTATSDADPSKRASAFVTVIEGANITGSLPAGTNPDQVSGTQDATVTIDEQTKKASQVELLLNGTVAGSKTLSTSSSVQAATRKITVTMDTRKLPDGAVFDGTPIQGVFLNGPYTVEARVTFQDGSTQTAELFDIKTVNMDEVVLTPADDNSSAQGNGQTYLGGGDVTFYATPLIFTTPNDSDPPVWQSVTGQATGDAGTGTATLKDADLGSGHGAEHTDSSSPFALVAGEADNDNEIEDDPGSAGHTIEVTDAETDPSQATSAFILDQTTAFLDFTAPSKVGVKLVFKQDNKTSSTENFLSAGSFEMTGVTDEGVGGGVGVLFYENDDASNTAESPLQIADLAENDNYTVRTDQTRDALGNTRDASNVSSSPKFAVDKTGPGFSNTAPADGDTIDPGPDKSRTVRWTTEDPALASGDAGAGVDNPAVTAAVVNETENTSTTVTTEDPALERDGQRFFLDVSSSTDGTDLGDGDYTVTVTSPDLSDPANQTDFIFEFTVSG